MKTLSPFPHKVEITQPLLRMKRGDITDQEFVKYLQEHVVGYQGEWNPLIKEYKKNIACAWCNYMFGVDAWDFEEESTRDGDLGDVDYRIWICFKDAEDATFFALKWS